MAQIVAVDLKKDGDFVQCEFVGTKGGWTTVIESATGIEHKVRNSQVAMDEGDDAEHIDDYLTDDEGSDDGEERIGGDVFPPGIRETYQMGTTEDGSKYIDNGDALAQELRGASLEAVAKMASEIVQEPKQSAKAWLEMYTTDREAIGKDALNPGMVRMNLGNRIRAALKRKAEEEAQEQAA